MYTINQQMKLEDSKDIFYSQQTSINDSTLLSSNSYGYSPHFKQPSSRPPRNYYPSFSYATNYYIPKEPMRSTHLHRFPACPPGRRRKRRPRRPRRLRQQMPVITVAG